MKDIMQIGAAVNRQDRTAKRRPQTTGNTSSEGTRTYRTRGGEVVRVRVTFDEARLDDVVRRLAMRATGSKSRTATAADGYIRVEVLDGEEV